MNNIFELQLALLTALSFVLLYVVNTNFVAKIAAYLISDQERANALLVAINGFLIILIFGLLFTLKNYSK